ncbi:hypothetical protein J6590_009337 [Homalodisca vitripennis]|nr:hypothetical protein J6590_009337 [Homalodisca vitripennis]
MHRKIRNYPEEAVNSAIQAVENGSSLRAAARMFNIPESTLRTRYHGREPETTKKNPLGMSIPTVQEEEMIAERVMTMMQDGFPISRKQLLAIASDTLRGTSAKRSSKKVYVPNMKWLPGFLRRHSEISEKLAQDPIIESELMKWFYNIIN